VLWDKYRRCTEGVKLPTLNDVHRIQYKTLEAAEADPTFDQETISIALRALRQKFAERIVIRGKDGFVYQMDYEHKPPEVYLLTLGGMGLTEGLWTGLLQSSGAEGFEAARKLMAAVFSDETPTFELSSNLCLPRHAIHFDDLKALLPASLQEIWSQVSIALDRVLHERGYRSVAATSTYQEHQLNGSSVYTEYSRQPYKPLGLVNSETGYKREGAISFGIEEVRLARSLCVFTAAHYAYYGLPDDGARLPVSLEPLNDEGNTLSDPRALDKVHLGELLKQFSLKEAIDRCVVPAVKRADFPNQRS